MALITYCVYIAIIYVIIWFIKLFYRQRDLPHGPLPYPIVGNIPYLNKHTHEKLDRLANEYGPIFTLWFARTPIVVVNDAQAAEEVFARNGSKFSDRPDFINKIITKRSSRLPYMNFCPKFQRNQTICIKACQVDESYLDEVLAKSLLDMCRVFESKASMKSCQPSDTLRNTVMNLMSEIIYGMQCKNAMFSDFNLPGNKFIFNLINTTSIFQPLRLLRPGPYLQFKKFIQNREKILRETFDESLTAGNSKSIMSNIMNALNEIDGDDNSAQAELLCSDLFLVSIEKIAATLDWMFLYFITWPEIQYQVFEELRSMKLKRSDNNISLKDVQKNPFLQAAVYETLRLSSLSPLSTVHKTNDIVTLKGHKLQKGTCVCVNLNAIHHNSKYWNEPYQFNPSRFLDGAADGTKSLKDINSIKGFFPFGQGIRKCFGEDLTLHILTTIMANLILHFNFDVSPWHLRPSLSGTSRLILVPQEYHISISKR